MEPHPYAQPGHVYVIEFSNGTIKVGKARSAERRLAEHRKNAEVVGAKIAQSWFSPLHWNYEENERSLIKLSQQHGGCSIGRSSEYFAKLDFDVMVKNARNMTFSLVTEDQIRAQKVAQEADAGVGHKWFQDRQRANEVEATMQSVLQRIKIITALENEYNREESNEQMFQVIRDFAETFEASWSDEEVSAGISRFHGGAPLLGPARDFHLDLLALFFLSHQRWPESADELMKDCISNITGAIFDGAF